MVPGKMLNRFLPRSNTGTHCSVNFRAQQVIQQFHPSFTLPHWRDINFYEGWRRGVDGLWVLYDKHLPSRSVYNPINHQGRGLEEIWLQFSAVQTAWRKKSVTLPQHLAFLSHIITDVCTPAHHFGQLTPVRLKRWLGFWSIHDDWADNSWQHFWFELTSSIRLLFSPITPAALEQSVIEQFQSSQNQKEFIQQYMRTTVEQLYSYNIFHDFNQFGWTAKIDQTMQQQVLPKIISTVATLWYLAAPTSTAP